MATSTRTRLARRAIERAGEVSSTHRAVAEVYYRDLSGDRPPMTSAEVALELDIDRFTSRRVLREVRVIGQGVLEQHRGVR